MPQFGRCFGTRYIGYGLLESTLPSPNQAMELAGLARAAFLSEPNQLPREPLSVKVGAHEQALSHHNRLIRIRHACPSTYRLFGITRRGCWTGSGFARRFGWAARRWRSVWFRGARPRAVLPAVV